MGAFSLLLNLFYYLSHFRYEFIDCCCRNHEEQSKSYGFDTWVVIFIIIFVVFIGILFVFYIHSCV